jgi:hypothetical protein
MTLLRGAFSGKLRRAYREDRSTNQLQKPPHPVGEQKLGAGEFDPVARPIKSGSATPRAKRRRVVNQWNPVRAIPQAGKNNTEAASSRRNFTA